MIIIRNCTHKYTLWANCKLNVSEGGVCIYRWVRKGYAPMRHACKVLYLIRCCGPNVLAAKISKFSGIANIQLTENVFEGTCTRCNEPSDFIKLRNLLTNRATTNSSGRAAPSNQSQCVYAVTSSQPHGHSSKYWYGVHLRAPPPFPSRGTE